MSDTNVSTASAWPPTGAHDTANSWYPTLAGSPPIAKWLAAHPRFRMHFTPTYSSWLNQVERWFALLTDQQLRRGVHTSIYALEKDIHDWITTWNQDPKPSAWTTTADDIPERLASYLHNTLGARCLSAHP